MRAMPIKLLIMYESSVMFRMQGRLHQYKGRMLLQWLWLGKSISGNIMCREMSWRNLQEKRCMCSKMQKRIVLPWRPMLFHMSFELKYIICMYSSSRLREQYSELIWTCYYHNLKSKSGVFPYISGSMFQPDSCHCLGYFKSLSIFYSLTGLTCFKDEDTSL